MLLDENKNLNKDFECRDCNQEENRCSQNDCSLNDNRWNSQNCCYNMYSNNGWNNNADDCYYEPTGINAQFGYNTMNLFNKSNEQMCCKKRDEIGEEMLSQIRCLKFAITDLGEYLNTHPNDEKALCLYREYAHELRELSDKYQKIYGPLSIYFPCNSWRWLEEPWPWERGDR